MFRQWRNVLTVVRITRGEQKNERTRANKSLTRTPPLINASVLIKFDASITRYNYSAGVSRRSAFQMHTRLEQSQKKQRQQQQQRRDGRWKLLAPHGNEAGIIVGSANIPRISSQRCPRNRCRSRRIS